MGWVDNIAAAVRSGRKIKFKDIPQHTGRRELLPFEVCPFVQDSFRSIAFSDEGRFSMAALISTTLNSVAVIPHTGGRRCLRLVDRKRRKEVSTAEHN